MGITDEQYKDAARKAYAAGDVATARKLLARVIGGATDPHATNNERARMARAGQLPPMSAERAVAQAEIDQNTLDRLTLDQTPGAATAVTKFAQGIPFIGEYSDEITGAIGNAFGGLTGDPSLGDRAMGSQRAVQDAMGRQHPVQSAALGLVGGIVGGLPIAAVAAPAAISYAPASLGGKMVLGSLVGAGVGGVEGAVSGYGAGKDGDRVKSAQTRGLIGAALGGALGAAAPVAVAGVKNLAEYIKGYDVNIISKTLGINKDAAKVIKAAVAADDFPAAEAAMKRAGADAILADASPGSAQLLDTSVQTSGVAARIGRDAVEARATAANTRLKGVMDTILGEPEGVKSAAKDVASRTSKIRSMAYDRAYSSAINYADDTGRAIEDVLQRIDPATLKSAVSEANDAMRAAGIKNMQIMAEIGKNGEVVFREMPNVQQLDEIKKALGAIGRSEVDQFGRATGKGIRANKLAGELKDAVGNAVPTYKTAVKLGGDKIAEDQALDLGRKLLLPSTTRETVRNAMGEASKEAKAAARKGLRSYIDDTLANVKRTITDPNIDAREASKAVKDLSSRANVEKVTEVLGSRAKPLFDTIDEVAAHFELRAAVARNSATASRIAGKEAVDAVTAPGPLGKLLAGEPINAMKSIIKALTGHSDAAMAAKKQTLYAEIAKALVTKKGAQAEAALKAIAAAIQGQPISSADALRIGRVLTTGASLGGYQLGSQSLTKP